MSRRLSVLDHVRVASPCPESWVGMTGDDRARHCSRCNLNVYNLSEMKRSEAEALLLAREGRLCIRYFQRADGTVLTRDCPVGLSIARRKLARVLGGIAAAAAFVVGGLHALARGERGSQELRLRYFEPFSRIIAWLTPPQPPPPPIGIMVMGEPAPPSRTHRDDLEVPPTTQENRRIMELMKALGRPAN